MYMHFADMLFFRRDFFIVSDPTKRINMLEVISADLNLICELSNSRFYLSMQKISASRVQRKSDSVDNLHIYQLVVEANNLTTAGTGKVWGTAMVWNRTYREKH